jgi:hypothetical protein
MKKLLFATTAAVVMAWNAPALADAISLTATVDGVTVATASSATGTLSIVNQAFGPDFNLNSLDINDQNFLAPPGVLDTNTINVDQTVGGSHQLVIDIAATGLTLGSGGLQAFLSEFSVTGLTNGWSAQESTTINGVLLSSTPLFTANSASADINGSALIGSTFTADVHYLINSVGTGQFNGGIDINTRAVPGPIVGAGLPGLISGLGGLIWLARRRRQRQA